MPDTQKPAFKWWMMTLMVLTGTFVAAMPMSSLPALFKEMSVDLGLSIPQIGWIWGISSLAGIFVSLLAGVLADRFGTRRILIWFCILTGITGALRGVGDSYGVLIFTVFLNGAVRLIVPVAVTKSIGLWFRGPRLGLAMGLGAMGMGLGLMLGPLLSATVLSPWLGGWRNVMFFLGGLSAFVGLLWWFAARDIPGERKPADAAGGIPVRRAVGELIRVRALWIIALALMFRIGGMMGMTGYIPTYLKDLQWNPAAADGTLSAFYAVSTLCVVPLAYLSDRLRSRLKIMVPAAAVGMVCMALLPTAEGALVWTLMIVCGIFMDGYMSLSTTLVMETEGVKPEYSGIALGMVFTVGQLGAVSAPPLGNALEAVSAGAPFYFWAALGLASFVILLLYRERRPALALERSAHA